MRPIRLTVEGFTSFRTRQTIDFTDLDLFAITGATGAGKSSILDAITFALYKKVARKCDLKELVTQGETSLKVEFQFQVKQTEYKAVRTWQDSTSRQNNFVLEFLNYENWERCQSSVEDILSMDFDTFTRVIVLPQGQFDEFLKGDARKRREMLRHLCGLNIFESMRKESSDRASQFKLQLEKITGILEGLQLPTDEEIKNKQTELKELELNIPRLTKNRDDVSDLLTQEEKLLEQINNLEKLRQELLKINLQESEIKDTEKQLKLAQVANRLNSHWVLVKDIRTKFIGTEEKLQATKEKLDIAKNELKIQQKNCEYFLSQASEKEAEFGKRDQDLATAKAYSEQEQQAQQEFNQANKKLNNKSQQYTEREADLKEAQTSLDKARQRLETVVDTLSSTSSVDSRLEILNRVISLIPQWENLSAQNKKTKEKLDKIVREKETLNLEHIENLKQSDILIVKSQEIEQALEAAKANNESIAQTNQAATIRASLHLGDDCPVCGGKYPEQHLLPLLPDADIIDLQPLEKSFQEAQKSDQQLQISITQIESRLESIEKNKTEHQQELAEFQKQLTKSQTHIEAILNTKEWNAQALKEEQQELSQKQEKYQQALTQKRELETEIDKLEQSLGFCQTNLESARQELITTQEEVELRQQQLQDVRDKLNQITQGKSYDSLKQQLEADKKDWQDRKQQAKTKFHEAQNSFTKTEANYNNANDDFTKIQAQKQQLEAQWQTVLLEKDFTETSFQAAQAPETKQQEWQKAIASHEDEKRNIFIRIKTIQETIGDRTTDETAVANRQEAKQTAEKKLKELDKQKTELELWLKDTVKKQEQSKDLLERQSQVQQQEQTYNQLALDLQSNNFQDYILKHLERELVTRATVLLANLTENRYALKIRKKGKQYEYCVEDNWNAGEERGIRTLSGGETFAASLAMALSLSEKLSMGAELGCLFLDEGFGTLDHETLDSVTCILDSLRQQDRMIGVITHISSLAEQFTQIKVNKSQQGSQLKVEHN